MSVNHGLLTSLGVSHPRLERLRYLVDQAGVGWTKLTGAGGGGCAITLLKPESTMPDPPATASLNGHKKLTNGDYSSGVSENGTSRSLSRSGPKPNGSNSSHHAPPFANGNGEAAFEPSPPRTALLELEKQLADEGFIKYETSLGGDGVGVLYPAIVNEEEIDLEMFLTAEGREGIEELVGGRHDRDAWKYWRP
ncbi:hypothetical protein MRB53_039458 [Persea americana]|nr:hypothetical protein MRB53_039458 [Persea americana]